jgi:hypothetical protein
MANAEHLALLKEDVEKWNQWRKDNSNVIPDLSGVKLKLRKAGLRRAHLKEEANLHDAVVLMRAALRDADLRGADLHSRSDP